MKLWGKIVGSGYFVVSSETVCQPYLEFRILWKHFYLTRSWTWWWDLDLMTPVGYSVLFLKSGSYRSVHTSELYRELLVGHWYAKLTFHCLRMFQDHLNCNSTGKEGWKCEIKSLWAWFMKKLQTIYIGKECMKILYSVPTWFIKFLSPVHSVNCTWKVWNPEMREKARRKWSRAL